MDIEVLYNTVKDVLPILKSTVSKNSSINDGIEQVSKIIEIVDNMGGIKTLSLLFNSNEMKNALNKGVQNNRAQNNTGDILEINQSEQSDIPPISSLRKIKNLD